MARVTNEEVLQAFQTIGRLLEEVYGVRKEDLLVDKAIKIPAHIFRSKLSPFSSIATYLHQQGHDAKKIAKLLKRNKSFVKKSIKDSKLDTTGTKIPITIFTGKLSVLEAAVDYLAKTGLDNAEIAEELGKSTSSIWTLRKRAEEKHER